MFDPDVIPDDLLDGFSETFDDALTRCRTKMCNGCPCYIKSVKRCSTRKALADTIRQYRDYEERDDK